MTPRSMGAPARLRARRYDGEEFAIEATISKAEINGQPLCTVILRDLSARLRLEAEARQAQRIEAVEQLAGGVAHQFNNYLGIILGYSDLLSEEAGINERLCRYVAEISFATQNAASLTAQLLAFGRKQVPVARVLNLNTWLGESESMLRQLVPAHVEVVLDLAPKVGPIHADPAQIQQMLANLLLNARDAMPDGGKATIATADVEFDEACANQSGGVHPGNYVSLAITDTGHGMSADTREHLFEPFYTTQEVGKGAGLGLAAVFGIVKDSGGHISVETCEGGGTTFRIHFPRVSEPLEKSTLSVLRPLREHETATILVVEDDAALRRLICHSLEKQMHKVLTAGNGVEAVKVFQEHAAQIQLVITDLVMPHMNGLELKEKIEAIAPGIRFLLMSGFSEQVVSQHRQLIDGCDFLEKPFRLEQLAKKVTAVLQKKAA